MYFHCYVYCFPFVIGEIHEFITQKALKDPSKTSIKQLLKCRRVDYSKEKRQKSKCLTD